MSPTCVCVKKIMSGNTWYREWKAAKHAQLTYIEVGNELDFVRCTLEQWLLVDQTCTSRVIVDVVRKTGR